MPPTVRLELDHPDLLIGLLAAEGITVRPAGGQLRSETDALVARRVTEPFPPEPLRAAVRDVLRYGGFKPTGRNKPASEYLANAAARGEFPVINNVVDVANLVSLESGLPISLLDLDRALVGTDALVIRFGRPGEGYVFNNAEQVIDVAGLVCVTRAGGEALANPVKDSMATKTGPDTCAVLAVVYASADAVGRSALADVMAGFATRVVQSCGGAAQAWLLP